MNKNYYTIDSAKNQLDIFKFKEKPIKDNDLSETSRLKFMKVPLNGSNIRSNSVFKGNSNDSPFLVKSANLNNFNFSGNIGKKVLFGNTLKNVTGKFSEAEKIIIQKRIKPQK